MPSANATLSGSRWEVDSPELSDEEFAWFREFIYRQAGIRIPETKRILVKNRLRRRLKATGIPDFATYYTHLTSPRGTGELPLFLDAITTNETYFDRDPRQYAWFQETFLTEVASAGRARFRPRRLHIWSAACSTGEEAYSLALRLHEERARFPGWDLRILGTDISGEAIESARAACYDARALRLITPERRLRGFDFDPGAQRWTVKPEVRTLATWKLHNLLKPLPEPPFDCIFLKNVLIYFDVESKKAVVSNVLRALAPGGYLVAGLTEGVYNLLAPLERLQPWLYRKPATAGTPPPSS